MKIMFINTYYYPNEFGGAEKSLRILAEKLATKGYEVVILSTFKKTYIEKINNVKVYYLSSGNLFWRAPSNIPSKKIKSIIWHFIDSFLFINKTIINKIIADEKPHIIHTNQLSGFSRKIWKLVSKKGIPLFHTFRDHYLICYKSTMYKKKWNCEKQCLTCKILRKNSSKYLNFVDGFTAISDYILNRHLSIYKHIHTKPRWVISNSISINEKKVMPTFNNITFGYLGDMSDIKGINILLRAFNDPRLKSSKIVIFTDANENAKIINRFNNIIKVPRQTNPFEPGLFNILIVPTISNETFGRVVIEAYSFGIPVITSRIGGLTEIVKDGINGYLLYPINEEQLIRTVQKIKSLSKNELETMSKNNLDVVQKYNTEDIIKNYISIYEASNHS